MGLFTAFRTRVLAAGLAALVAIPAVAAPDPALAAAIAGPQRSDANRARDTWRHPAETLAFFGIRPDMTVVEISPGGGWYTEILAPYLREGGKLYAAAYPAKSEVEYFRKSRAAFEVKLAAAPSVYDRVVLTDFAPPTGVDIAPAGSADLVLTFRNMHNWLGTDDGEVKVLEGAFRALKPGGVLGIVEHRTPKAATRKQMYDLGYMTEDAVVGAARKAGFVLEASSDVNANPRDTHDHPEGVWNLPPTLSQGETDRAKYLAIGETDRMTLRFRKPAQ